MALTAVWTKTNQQTSSIPEIGGLVSPLIATAGGNTYSVDRNVVKFDSTGNILWTLPASSDPYLIPVSTGILKDGSLVIASKSRDHRKGVISIIGSDGTKKNEIDFQIYPPSPEDPPIQTFPYTLSPAKDGGFFVVGMSPNFGGGNNYDAQIIKYDANGNRLFHSALGSSRALHPY